MRCNFKDLFAVRLSVKKDLCGPQVKYADDVVAFCFALCVCVGFVG